MPQFTLADVVPPQQAGQGVISLEHNQTIQDAMAVLAKNGILSAPVLISPDLEDLAEHKEDTPSTQLAGWVDVNDIVREFLNSTESKLQSANMLSTMAVLEQDGPAFAERPLISLMGGKDKQLVYEGDRTLPLREALHKYFMGSDSSLVVHRIAVFDSSGRIESVISQMDVLRFVRKTFPDADWCKRTLVDAGLVQKDRKIVSVDINTPTLKAMNLLVKHGRSAVAVLSPEGKLITNLSSSDLRYLQVNHFGVLALPVGEFLGLLHGAVYVGAHAVDGDLRRSVSGSQQPPPPNQFFAQRQEDTNAVPLITVSERDTVIDAITRMVDSHVHRVYIVDDPEAEAKTPVALVTTTDIIAYVAKHLD